MAESSFGDAGLYQGQANCTDLISRWSELRTELFFAKYFKGLGHLMV